MGSAQGETSAPGSKPKVKSQPEPAETNGPKQFHMNKPEKLDGKPAATLCKITQITQTSVGGLFFFEGEHPSQRGKHFSLSYLSINQSISQSADVCEALNRRQRRCEAQKQLMPPELQEAAEQTGKTPPVGRNPEQTAPSGGRSQPSSPSCLGKEWN